MFTKSIKFSSGRPAVHSHLALIKTEQNKWVRDLVYMDVIMVVTVVNAMVKINMPNEEEGGFLFVGWFVTYFYFLASTLSVSWLQVWVKPLAQFHMRDIPRFRFQWKETLKMSQSRCYRKRWWWSCWSAQKSLTSWGLRWLFTRQIITDEQKAKNRSSGCARELEFSSLHQQVQRPFL